MNPDEYTSDLNAVLNFNEQNQLEVEEEQKERERKAQEEALQKQGLLSSEEYDEKLEGKNFYGQTGFNSDFQGPTLEPTDAERFHTQKNFEGEGPGQLKLKDPEFSMLPVKGVLDTLKGAITSPVGEFLNPGGELGVAYNRFMADKYEELASREKNDAAQMVRDASGLIIPSLLGGAAVQGISKGVNATVMLGSKTKVAGELAARLGVDTAIAYSTPTSETDENMAETLNKWFGWTLPNATSDDDAPAVRREKHVKEAMGMFAFGELLGLGLKLFRRTKAEGVDEAAKEIVGKTKDVNLDDPITSAHKIVKEERQKIFDEEVVLRMEAGPGRIGKFGDVLLEGPRPIDVTPFSPEPGMAGADLNLGARQQHDPFIHKYTDAHETYIPNQGANALEAKIDIAEMVYNPKWPKRGRPVPAATQHYEKQYLGIEGPGEEADFLSELFDTTSAGVKAIESGQTKYTSIQVNEAIDIRTNQIINADVSVKEFNEIVEGLKKNVYEGHKFLTEEEFLVAAKTFKKIWVEMFDPNRMRASGMLMQNAVDNTIDLARAVNSLPNKDTGNLQAHMVEKLNILATEIRANQYIAGRSLEYKKLVKNGNHKKVQEWLKKETEEFDVKFKAEKAKGLKTVQTYKEIAEKNPEWLKTFAEAVDHTNGNVDTLVKLENYLARNVGVVRPLIAKKFNDGVPSWFVQGLISTRYNAMLAGKAFINAMEGNMIGLALKPVTTTLGAAAQRDGGALERALHMYGGMFENFNRAAKHMKSEWDFAVSNPVEAMMKGRTDLMAKQMDNLDIMEEAAEVWKKSGSLSDRGKAMIWNFSKSLYGFNNKRYVRFGMNAMYALDGFTNSMMQSGQLRAKAYEELASNRANYATKEAFTEAFRKKQRQMYNEYFDVDGAIRKDKELLGEARYQAGEIEFNLDDDFASAIAQAADEVPLIKMIMSFPRTGIDALKYTWTYTPPGGLTAWKGGVGKMGKIFNAKSDEQILDALRLHGYTGEEVDMGLFKQIKGDYIGRQMVGATAVTGALIYALNGNIRGNWPPGEGKRKGLQSMKWEARTIKNPFTGKWVSYENKEPFTSLLATIGDLTYFSTNIDQDWGEQTIQKIVSALVVGPTSSTFLEGVGTLTELFVAGNEDAWRRFVTYQGTSFVPYSGTFSVFNRIVTPQLKIVEQDFKSQLQNRFKFLYPGSGHLADLLDVYTGEPIRYFNPIEAALQEAVPFFHTNAGEEEWRMQLIATGWTGMPRHQINPDTNGKLIAPERAYINNWVAQNYPLVERIKELLDESNPEGAAAMDSLKVFRELRAQGKVSGSDIKGTRMHQKLDEIHQEAFQMAFNDLRKSYEEFQTIGVMRKAAKSFQDTDARRSAELNQNAENLEKKYHKKLREDMLEKSKKREPNSYVKRKRAE